jgi:Circularly permutated YpsA SLOG family
MQVREVWSGGQTGVDRAAWDAARGLGIPIAGWVPRGRRAEDGVIPATYGGVQETPSSDYAQRTSWNVRDTDATLILCDGPLTGGSAFTCAEAERLGRPLLVLNLSAVSIVEAAGRARTWLTALPGTRLNVAGPRASRDSGLYRAAHGALTGALARDPAGHP